MYPYLRLVKMLAGSRSGSKLAINDESILKLRVWPSDIDPFIELNNGRYLTMMDFGRFDIALRSGLWKLVKKKSWGLAVAGSSVRYRYRLKLFQKYELHSKVIGHDDKWFYFHQKIIRNGRLHCTALIRTAITSKNGIVKTGEVLGAMDLKNTVPEIPDWVKAWVDADELRPWT